MSSTATVISPSSAEEAAAAIAADPEATIMGGGTLVMAQLALGYRAVDRAVWLGRAGLDAVNEADGRLTIGGMATLATCVDLVAPIGPCASNIGDSELRAQATLGGNICSDLPFGDLQGPLLALDASVRLGGAGGERTVGAAAFFADIGGDVVLDVSFDVPAAGAFVPLRRHHTHAPTAIGVSAVRSSDGEVRIAATGVAPDARRLSSVESALAGGATAPDAAEAAPDDIDPYDDVMASAAHRSRVLPTLVRRALDQLGG